MPEALVAREAVEHRRHDHIDFAISAGLDQPVESRAELLRSRDTFVNEFLHKRPATFLDVLARSRPLRGKRRAVLRLFLRRDAAIRRCPHATTTRTQAAKAKTTARRKAPVFVQVFVICASDVVALRAM